jgi:insulysin
VIQCLSKSEKDHVLIELLSSVLEEPFYEDLRTTQQLGYIVSSGVKGFEDTRNLNLVVQSSVAPAEKLTGAILLFLEQFRQSRLQSLSDKDISSFVKGLLDSKL